MVVVSGRSTQIIDATPGRTSGVAYANWLDYSTKYKELDAYTPVTCEMVGADCSRAPQMSEVTRYARNLLGVRYNLSSAKGQSFAFGTYCSLLVWESYMSINVDVDSDGGPVVFPDDISESRSLVRWKVSVSP